tara:strand:+ start:345 stop:1787 length:1443 start_codon:yes stop_codon:yes gene_type:complete
VKKFPLEITIPKKVLAVALLAVFLSAIPFLFIHPFVDASADPAAHISTLAIGDKLPETYGEYSELKYSYQIGFPLLAKLFVEFFSFIESSTIIWFIGLFTNFLQVILIYLVAKKFFDNDNAGFFSAAIFVAGKLLYQNIFWGQYTWMLGSVFLLGTLLTILHKHPSKYLFFPAILIVHPGSAFEAIILFGAYFLIFSDLKSMAKFFLSGILAIQSYFITYQNIFSFKTGSEIISISVQEIFKKIIVVPPWIGIVPFLLGSIGTAYFFYTKKINRKLFFLIFIFATSVFLNVFTGFFFPVIAGRIIELGFISSALIGGYFLAELPLLKNKNTARIAVLLVLLFGAFFYVTSSQLEHLRSGSKISEEEIEFAQEFRNFDPELKKAIIFAEGKAKIAEYSNKVPYDVKNNFYISYSTAITGEDPFQQEIEKRHSLYEKILAEKCSDCLTDVDAEYVIIDSSFTGLIIDNDSIFEHGTFKVYVN